MKLFIAVFLFLVLGGNAFANDPTAEDGMSRNALRRALESVNLIRSWINEPSEVREQLEKCAPGNSAFTPKFEQPPPTGELAQRLCRIMPPFRPAAAYTLERKLPETSCTFVSYGPCTVEFIKRVQFKDSVGLVPVKWGANKKPYFATNYTAFDIAFVAVRCDLVSLAGLIPKWICGSGFDRAHYLDDEVKFELTHLTVGLPLSYLRYEEMNAPELLTKFLKELNLPN